MSDWGILDDNSLDTDGDVEYVGMADDDDVPPVRVPRRPVQRAARAVRRTAQRRPMQPQKTKNGMYHMPTASGAEVAMNAEAIENMRNGGLHDVGGRTAMRVQPGTYVTYGPGRGPSGQPGVGIGGMGLDFDFDIGEIVGGVAELTTAIGQTVIGARTQRQEAELAAEALRLENEAAAEARLIAERENVREHQLRLAEIRQQQQELEELRRTQAQLEQEQAQYAATTPAVAGGGASPVVWVLLAVVGIGGVGALVWFLTKDKGKAEEK